MGAIKFFVALTLCAFALFGPGAVHAVTMTLSGGNFDALGNKVTLGTAVLESGGLLPRTRLRVGDPDGTSIDINGTFDPDDLKNYRDLLIRPTDDLDLQHAFDGITYVSKIGTTLAVGKTEVGCEDPFAELCVPTVFFDYQSNWVINDIEVLTPSSWGAIGFAPNSASFNGHGDRGTLTVELRMVVPDEIPFQIILFSASGTPDSVVDQLNMGFFSPIEFTDVPPWFLIQEVYTFDNAFGTFTFDPIHGFIPAPEPATLAILALGLAGLGFMRRRRA